MTITHTLKKHAHGNEVIELQNTLIGAGYGKLLGSHQADGDFGNGTDKAVKQFQRDHGLKADGVVGPKTLAALEALGHVASHKPTHPTPHVPMITLPSPTPYFGQLQGMSQLPWLAPLAPVNQEKPLIVIDPGHGTYMTDGRHPKARHDPGAVVKQNGSELYEDSINLAVAQKLKVTLEKKGFAVQLTHDADDVLGSRFKSRIDTGAGKKVLHLSVHADSGANAPSGLKIYTHKKCCGASVDFAESLSNPGTPIVRDSKRVGGILNPKLMNGVPAALVEVGNMQSKEELARLTSPGGQQAIADILADRITTHYTNTMSVADASLPKLPQKQESNLNSLFAFTAFTPNKGPRSL